MWSAAMLLVAGAALALSALCGAHGAATANM